MEPRFAERLQRARDAGRLVSVGLDSEVGKIPDCVRPGKGGLSGQTAFNRAIIRATAGVAGAYKPNMAFYEGEGPFDGEGMKALARTFDTLHEEAPGLCTILDYKRGDIANTNQGYLKLALELGADAVTVPPYLGMEAMRPFLDQEDLGIIVLCRTSNPGAGEFQDKLVVLDDEEVGQWMGGCDVDATALGEGRFAVPLYQYTAWRVSRYWNYNNNCALVVGATYPRELGYVRKIVGNGMVLLLPGLGAQGGDLEECLEVSGEEVVFNDSRKTIFASNGPDFAEAARARVEHVNAQIAAARAAA